MKTNWIINIKMSLHASHIKNESIWLDEHQYLQMAKGTQEKKLA